MAQSSLPSSASVTTTTAPRSSLSLLSAVYHQGGLRALWRGAVPTALRDAPGAGLFMVFYERTKTLLPSAAISPTPSSSGKVTGGVGAVGGGTAGAIASLFSTLLTTPFDLLKTRRQLSPSLYPTLSLSIRRVYSHGGITAFWEGASLRCGRKAGSAGVGWAVYESVLGGWEKRVGERIRERELRGA